MGYCNKSRYTKKDAQSTLSFFEKQGNFRDGHGRIYQCPICNHWHLTHSEEFTEMVVEPVELAYKDKWEKLLKRAV